MKNFAFKKKNDVDADMFFCSIKDDNHLAKISSIAVAMKKATEEKKVREEAECKTKAKPHQSQRLNLSTIKVADVTADDAEKLTSIIQENRQYAEELGQKKADLEDTAKKLKDAISEVDKELIPPKLWGTLVNNKHGLQQIEQELKRLERDEPGIRAHTDLAYLIRKIEIEIEFVRKGGQAKDVACFMELALKSGRFRAVTKDERNARIKPSHTVSFGKYMIVPGELTRGNKVLAERLIELCRLEKERGVISVIKAADDMSGRATQTLIKALEQPKGGEVVYIHFPKKQLSGGKWLSSGHLLCELEQKVGKYRLAIRDIVGPEVVVEDYKAMKKAGRFLPLAFIKAGRITAFLNPDVFNDTRIFLRDVLRGLEYEKAIAVNVNVVCEKRSENMERLEVR